MVKICTITNKTVNLCLLLYNFGKNVKQKYLFPIHPLPYTLLPMGIWDRLNTVINSYLHDDDVKIFGKKPASRRDPDLDAAFEELDDYLNRDKAERSGTRSEQGYSWADSPNGRTDSPDEHSHSQAGSKKASSPPEELRPCFAELGVPFGASHEECKEAYKKLLKIHHPDRHANHEGNFKKATEKTARLTVAYERIKKWREK